MVGVEEINTHENEVENSIPVSPTLYLPVPTVLSFNVNNNFKFYLII